MKQHLSHIGVGGLARLAGLSALLGLSCANMATAQTTTLADQPVFAGADVPGNLALALSVEFPTAISVANIGNYSDSTQYLGYFDPLKCYTYDANNNYFKPISFSTGTNHHSCSGNWSGNFMNWASMQTIDPFRWALSGGYRSIDTPTRTVLEKAWGSAQGSAGSNFNYRGTDQGYPNNLPSNLVASVTPFDKWQNFNLSIWGNGNLMQFSGTGTGYQTASTSASDELGSIGSANSKPDDTYSVYIRVDVCDPNTPLGVAGLESNCVAYPAAPATPTGYKPEGLMQQYSNKIRFSAFSYLNGYGDSRQGGVLREPMGFIGPTYPQPLSTTVITNSRPEWSATDGTMYLNPDTTLASASGVSQSGVMNYLNKFGEGSAHTYMTYDNVSELYYAALRYYENLGNVTDWTSSLNATLLDGFPAATTWSDPIAYSCQKNFILGIGDDHFWYDYNVGGGTATGGRSKPAAVASDTFNQAATWTTYMQQLQGISPTPWWPFDSGATYYIAGLAYGAHVLDIRPDLTGSQTVSTFWMDVEEGGAPEWRNPYYLAAKYGGFTVPANYSITNTTPLPQGEWDTSNGPLIPMNGGASHAMLPPDNYFLAGSANQMVTGLKSAFTNIANAIKAYTTSFAFSALNVSVGGTESFATQYDPTGWTGVITASTLTFDASGNPTGTPLWTTSTTLQAQLAGLGWQTARNVVTWNGTSAVPFQTASLTSSQLTALTPSSYSASTTSTQYLNYLRGDQRNEVGSSTTGSTQSLRARTLLLGDIVDASLTPVTTPNQTFSETTNPGYTAFNIQWTTTTPRPTMVYAGANDGMLHAFAGPSGLEQFAYIPSALFQGPNNTPQVDGLAQLGNPNYVHHYYVDATPYAFDIDLNRVNGNTSGSPNWRTLLIGGLGKGGKSYYAIDVTDPASMTSESLVAAQVKWEFTDPTMGYSFGAPVVVKTAKYGWVVALTSGYNNSDGFGYLYLVNPSTGALLEPPIKTPSASSGLTQASAFVKDYSDDTADSIYVGDLNGQVWRYNLTATTGAYPQPILFATLTDGSGTAQPITTAPLIEIHPTTRKRYVMVATGKLLASTDVISTQTQTFYSILDGTAGVFNPISTPITRANLTPLTQAQLMLVNTQSPTSKGWYTDLGVDPTSGIAWRVVINPQPYNGIVTFSSLLTSGDACSPTGQSRVYALNYATATSVLQNTVVPYYSSTNAVINIRFAGANGNPEIIIGFSSGNPPYAVVPANLTSPPFTRILNWREVPTAD